MAAIMLYPYFRKFDGNVCTDWRLTHDLTASLETADGKAKRVKQRRTLESAGDSAMAQGRYVVAAECYARAQKHAPDDANIAEKLENALSLSGSE